MNYTQEHEGPWGSCCVADTQAKKAALIDPVEDLLAMDRKIRQHMRRLPHAHNKNDLLGLGVCAGQVPLWVPLSDLKAVLGGTQLVKVPSLKPWVLGLTHLRGELMMVSDLFGFVAKRDDPITEADVFLVLEHHQELYGLYVDHIEGLMRFSERLRKKSKEQTPFDPFVNGSFKEPETGVCWHAVQLKKIITTPAFKQVGL